MEKVSDDIKEKKKKEKKKKEVEDDAMSMMSDMTMDTQVFFFWLIGFTQLGLLGLGFTTLSVKTSKAKRELVGGLS
jgi:hypothetical protein